MHTSSNSVLSERSISTKSRLETPRQPRHTGKCLSCMNSRCLERDTSVSLPYVSKIGVRRNSNVIRGRCCEILCAAYGLKIGKLSHPTRDRRCGLPAVNAQTLGL
jgi:aspartate carbamoyltransferase regulatory subunit